MAEDQGSARPVAETGEVQHAPPLEVMPIGHGDPLRPLATRSREWLEKVAHAALVRIMGLEELQMLSPDADTAAVAVERYHR